MHVRDLAFIRWRSQSVKRIACPKQPGHYWPPLIKGPHVKPWDCIPPQLSSCSQGYILGWPMSRPFVALPHCHGITSPKGRGRYIPMFQKSISTSLRASLNRLWLKCFHCDGRRYYYDIINLFMVTLYSSQCKGKQKVLAIASPV